MDADYSKIALKAIDAMDKKTKDRIKDAIEKIPEGDIRPLHGYKGAFRLRVGDWRIIFMYADGSRSKVLIAKIDTRGDVYKGRALK